MKTVPQIHSSTTDSANLSSAQAASCPEIQPFYQYLFPEQAESTQELIEPILDALNHGITYQRLEEGVSQVVDSSPIGRMVNGKFEHYRYENTLSTRDITGDGVPEILFGNDAWLNVLTCKHGQYILSLTLDRMFSRGEDLDFRDLNGNGVFEIVMRKFTDPLHGVSLLYIYEWDGRGFRNLVLPNKTQQGAQYPGALLTGQCSTISFSDQKINWIVDVIVRWIPCDFGERTSTGPYRWYSVILTWNGSAFQAGPEQLDPPVYRFQAVQDGDMETWRGNYEKALDFYNLALQEPSLKGWSKELYQQQHEVFIAEYEQRATPSPYPIDPDEMNVLSAYIHYRFVLLYSVQGRVEQAQVEYSALGGLSPDAPGFVYKRLADVFWASFQTNQNLATACARTREYANENYEGVFRPIDYTWHGWQSPGYSGSPNQDQVICPFE